MASNPLESIPVKYPQDVFDSVKEVYEKIAKDFDASRAYKWPCITDFMNSLPSQQYILDVGCGNGRNMEYKEHNFIGIDNCENFVKCCEMRGKQVMIGSMISLPFKNNTFDALIVIASFHHLKTPCRRIKALQEMKRVLLPGGKILISLWSKTQPKKTKRVFEHYGDTLVPWIQNNSVHQRYYYIFKIDEFKELCENVGLYIVQHQWDCGNEYFILEKRK